MQLDHLLSLVPAMVRQNPLRGKRRAADMASDRNTRIIDEFHANDGRAAG
ncbi:MAG: hypothetical protein ACXWWX_07325 [Actinomycetota bacterium]